MGGGQPQSRKISLVWCEGLTPQEGIKGKQGLIAVRINFSTDKNWKSCTKEEKIKQNMFVGRGWWPSENVRGHGEKAWEGWFQPLAHLSCGTTAHSRTEQTVVLRSSSELWALSWDGQGYKNWCRRPKGGGRLPNPPVRVEAPRQQPGSETYWRWTSLPAVAARAEAALPCSNSEKEKPQTSLS